MTNPAEKKKENIFLSKIRYTSKTKEEKEKKKKRKERRGRKMEKGGGEKG